MLRHVANKLKLSDFKVVSDITFIGKALNKEYYITNNNMHVGYMHIIPRTGQIGLIRIHNPYRGRDLGRQMLGLAYYDILAHKSGYIWAVTKHDHPFWSNIPGMMWTDAPIVHGVNNGGYSVAFNNIEFVNWIKK